MSSFVERTISGATLAVGDYSLNYDHKSDFANYLKSTATKLAPRSAVTQLGDIRSSNDEQDRILHRAKLHQNENYDSILILNAFRYVLKKFQ